MARQYLLKTHVHFAAAHVLRGYEGDCEQLHGHNYKVEIEVRATQLDELGMGVDFRAIRVAAREVVGVLDHRLLNDIPPFTEVNPTAEHIAAYVYEQLGRLIDNDRVRVHAVTIWETDRDSVRYSDE
ncbi:MAG TPA: 6-carboxytetrahydropterin synthase QueD [Enhygromyxa sp.]|nr:6-carboxytetrahydropterin synthase QueD [Enhygromyxa sp.]